MSLIAWIIIGLIAGWIASLIMKTDQQMGLLANLVVGMIGSIIGGFVVNLLTNGNASLTYAFTHFTLSSLLVSVLGAVILLGIVKLFRSQPSV